MVFDVGRVCVKTAGRDAGGYCVIVNKVDNDHVLVTGPKPLTGVRRRKVNLSHLEPIQEKVKVKADASDKDVLDAYKTADLYKKFGLKPLTAEQLKKWEEQKAEKEKKKAESKKRQEEEKKKLEKLAEEKKKQEAKKEVKPAAKEDVKITEDEKKLIEEAEKEVGSKKPEAPKKAPVKKAAPKKEPVKKTEEKPSEKK